MSVEQVLGSLQTLKKRGDITAWVELEAHPGRYCDVPDELAPQLARALHNRGIVRLYSHQGQAFRKAAEGRHLVVVTPTASGKTLCYNLPVLNTLLRDPDSRALYLFPTKALAQDQMAELQTLIEAGGMELGAHTYDGDTPSDMRRKIRAEGRLILTNPDMLHSAFLPHHPRWAHLFQNLRYVVIDELHSYRGVFGSHVANVFRRLKRIARFYNSKIQFLCSSATIANPAELASQLLEEEVECLQENGAPRARKDLIFYNPPIVHPQLGLRRSALSAGRRFAQSFLQQNVQTLVFTTSRVNVEVLLSYLRKALEKHPAQPRQVRGYRGGYLPRTRREIERQLRTGEILGVVATNALELGIDIGSLEACILTGYPGSVASTWQQIGRAGRRSGRSAAVLVARNLPLDQFIIRHPEYFLERSPEQGRIHPDNLQILVSHIKCAAFELPFQKGEQFGRENLEEILEFLTERRVLCKNGKSWHWAEESYPADAINLRNIAEENFVVLDMENSNRCIAEVDFESAAELIHPDAIYLCEGSQYHVERLDYDGRRAYVRPVKVDYYTQAITYSGLRVLRTENGSQFEGNRMEWGEVHLFKKIPGFKKIKFYTSENVGYGKIELPIQELHTTACWLSPSESSLDALALSRTEIIQALLGISYAMHHVATFLLMCDVRDLGRSVGDRSSTWFARSTPEGLGYFQVGSQMESLPLDSLERFEPALFLFDNLPGGVGFSERLFDCFSTLLKESRDLIAGCSCRSGCPSCVGPIDELGQATRRNSLNILQALIKAGSVASPVFDPAADEKEWNHQEQ